MDSQKYVMYIARIWEISVKFATQTIINHDYAGLDPLFRRHYKRSN